MADLEITAWKTIRMRNGEEMIAFEVYNPSGKWLESFKIIITVYGYDPSHPPIHARIRCEIAPHGTAAVTYVLGPPPQSDTPVATQGYLLDPIYH
ncbi:MAG: hypothetical protein HY314_03250 [Acidobacteria bacterium]|nr:hypothetical protein [Acidobacteriota bacterium]